MNFVKITLLAFLLGTVSCSTFVKSHRQSSGNRATIKLSILPGEKYKTLFLTRIDSLAIGFLEPRNDSLPLLTEFPVSVGAHKIYAMTRMAFAVPNFGGIQEVSHFDSLQTSLKKGEVFSLGASIDSVYDLSKNTVHEPESLYLAGECLKLYSGPWLRKNENSYIAIKPGMEVKLDGIDDFRIADIKMFAKKTATDSSGTKHQPGQKDPYLYFVIKPGSHRASFHYADFESPEEGGGGSYPLSTKPGVIYKAEYTLERVKTKVSERVSWAPFFTECPVDSMLKSKVP